MKYLLRLARDLLVPLDRRPSLDESWSANSTPVDQWWVSWGVDEYDDDDNDNDDDNDDSDIDDDDNDVYDDDDNDEEVEEQ